MRLFNEQDDELDDENEAQPYTSISGRAPLDDVSVTDLAPDRKAMPVPPSIPSRAPSSPSSGADPAVKAFLMNRANGGKSQSGTPFDSDPLMKQYNQEQQDLDQYRQTKLGADTLSNMGQSFAQLSRGTSAPTESPIFKRIAAQAEDLTNSKEKDLDGRRKVMDAIEARNSRSDIAKENRLSRESNERGKNADRKLARDAAQSNKIDKQVNTWITDLKKDLDPNGARGGNMAFNQKKIDQSERLEGLIKDSDGNLRNLDSRQMEELAIGINSMLSNSASSAVSQVEALVPKTAMGSAQKLKEWLTNDPTGTNQMAFVKRLNETVGREKEIATGQVRKAQKQRLSAYQKFREFAPAEYNQVLQGYGLNETPEESQPKSSPDPDLKNSYPTPQTGSVEDGHKFLGGDPSDPKNWEKVQ